MCFEMSTETSPMARREHRCIWCGEPIRVGEKYSRQKGKFDGEWQDNPWHDECLEFSRDTNPGCFDFTPYDGERPIITFACLNSAHAECEGGEPDEIGDYGTRYGWNHCGCVCHRKGR